MGITEVRADERVRSVSFAEDTFTVELMDGRSITTPIAWFPRLLHATAEQRAHWSISGAGYGIHWPQVDEDISTEGLLRGAPAPRGTISVLRSDSTTK